MKLARWTICVALFLLENPVVTPAQWGSRELIELAELQADAVEHAVEQVRGAVVQMRVIGEFRGVSRDASGVSTGLLLDRQWVVTSAFGLENRPKVLLVALPSGETSSATLESIDHGRNLALVRLATPLDANPPALEPADEPEPGETAIAVGAAYSPRSVNLSVGIVSATGRFLGRAVQTDAAASPANYGGPLVDLRGRVLGVITPLGQESGQLGATLYDSGIGFAVPLPDILDRLPQMQQGHDLHPGKAGLTFSKGNPYADPPRVAKLAPEGPAAVAGVKRGDIIQKVGVAEVATQKQLQVAMGPHDVGDKVTFELLRGDEEILTVELTLIGASDLKQPEKELPSLLKRLKLEMPKLD